MNHGLDTWMPTFSGDAEVDTKVPFKSIAKELDGAISG